MEAMAEQIVSVLFQRRHIQSMWTQVASLHGSWRTENMVLPRPCHGSEPARKYMQQIVLSRREYPFKDELINSFPQQASALG